MNRVFLLICSFFFLVACSQRALSDDQLILKYIDWIVENSELEYSGQPLPTVSTMSFEQMMRMAYTDEVYESGRELAPVSAIYDHHNNQIVVPDTTDIFAYINHQILVHELVHYLQDINGITDDCLGRLEFPAYELQAKWQDEFNHPSERPNRLWVYFLRAHCESRHN